MLKVANKKCIRKLSRKSIKASGNRNVIAVAAIALTAMLFTALFTISMTLVTSYEQATFRQVGGDFHGTFKNITEEQVKELSDDPLAKKAGARLFLGMPEEAPFNKAHVEVSYMDENCAEGYFCTPENGRLPQEGTNEIACDTRILSLLGVEPKIGAEINLTYKLGSMTASPIPVTDTFTLSGWWEYDPAGMASQAIVPRSYADKILSGYVRKGDNDLTGSWVLNIHLKNARHIEEDLKTILANHGYQSDDINQDNYVGIGVNWAYTGAQLSANADPTTVIGIVGMLLLIIFTGYLIIYNIFQISVTNDIRFYGLLKTIGTTSKQIRAMIRAQAFTLSAIGIPIGLILGYFAGVGIAPMIVSKLSAMSYKASVSPVIFLGGTLFSLLTVYISCRKPGKIAGRVSPVEAVRYTEGANTKRRKKPRRSQKGAKISRMAFANLGRNRVKTVLVTVSLALAVVLMQVTYMFTTGFDMDKYLRTWVVTDFIMAHADYFQTGKNFGSEDNALPEEAIEAVNAEGGVTESGRIYGQVSGVQEFVTEDWFRASRNKFMNDEVLDMMLETKERTPEGLITDNVLMYGMEKLPLDHLKVVAGDTTPLYDPSQNAIAAVYSVNDYDEVHEDSQWADVGDKVKLRYVDEWESFDLRTGQTFTPEQLETMEKDPELFNYIGSRAKKFHEVEYTVAACVVVPHPMSYRYYGSDQFVLNSEVFKRDTGTSSVMTYLFNTTPESNAHYEEFMKDYTENVNTLLDYESKQSYADEFNGFRNMFLMLGGLLSFVIGLVGVLNFFNAILTGILTRRREFAVLQAVGMTGQQLKQMLIYEGVCYAGMALAASFILSLAFGPMMGEVMTSMFWFFTYRFSLLPIACIAPLFLLMGLLLPLITHRFANRQSIVERIRAED